jgi:hypothetical protein
MDLLHYYPLIPGAQHTYQFQFLGRPEGTLTLEVLDAQERPNGTFARVRRTISGAESENYAVILKNGELRVDGHALLRDVPVGTRWEQAGEGGLLEYELVGHAGEVTVPAGTFAGCLEIKVRRDGVVISTTLLAPGVGMVWHRAAIPGGYTELHLVRHDPGLRIH